MISERLTVTRYVAAVLVGVALLAAVSTAEAHTQWVGGIKVTYSKPGFEAYHDQDDDTLTIRITQGGGSLNVKATPAAIYYWGSECDVYLWGMPGVDIKNIKLKGYIGDYDYCVLYVCGYVHYVKKFTLQYGAVGYTWYYGRDFGLYRDSQFDSMAKKIIMKWAWAYAAVLAEEGEFFSLSSRGKPAREDVCKAEVSPEERMVLGEAIRAALDEEEEEDVEGSTAEVEAKPEPVELDVSAGDAVGFFQSLLLGGK